MKYGALSGSGRVPYDAADSFSDQMANWQPALWLSDINKSISNVDGTKGYILNIPSSNITFKIGEIPVLGEVKFV
jgi:uncharacterized phage protein gp47/JayE